LATPAPRSCESWVVPTQYSDSAVPATLHGWRAKSHDSLRLTTAHQDSALDVLFEQLHNTCASIESIAGRPSLGEPFQGSWLSCDRDQPVRRRGCGGRPPDGDPSARRLAESQSILGDAGGAHPARGGTRGPVSGGRLPLLREPPGEARGGAVTGERHTTRGVREIFKCCRRALHRRTQAMTLGGWRRNDPQRASDR